MHTDNIRIHSYKHTHTHTRTHMYSHVRTRTRTYILIHTCTHSHMDSLRGLSVKIGTIQRSLAWPLHKDDACKSRSVNEQQTFIHTATRIKDGVVRHANATGAVLTNRISARVGVHIYIYIYRERERCVYTGAHICVYH